MASSPRIVTRGSTSTAGGELASPKRKASGSEAVTLFRPQNIDALMKKGERLEQDRHRSANSDNQVRSSKRSRIDPVGFPVKIFARSVKGEKVEKLFKTSHVYEATVIGFGSPAENIPDSMEPQRFTSELIEQGSVLRFTTLVHTIVKEKYKEMDRKTNTEVEKEKSTVKPILDERGEPIHQQVEVRLGVFLMKLACLENYTSVEDGAFIGLGKLHFTSTVSKKDGQIYLNPRLSSMNAFRRVENHELAPLDALYARLPILHRALNGYQLPAQDMPEKMYHYQTFALGPSKVTDLYGLREIALEATARVLGSGEVTDSVVGLYPGLAKEHLEICMTLARRKLEMMEMEPAEMGGVRELSAALHEIADSVLAALNAVPLGQRIEGYSSRPAINDAAKADGWGLDVCTDLEFSSYLGEMTEESPGMVVFDPPDNGTASLLTDHGLPDDGVFVQSLGRALCALNALFTGQYRSQLVEERIVYQLRPKLARFEWCPGTDSWLIPVQQDFLQEAFEHCGQYFYIPKMIGNKEVDMESYLTETQGRLRKSGLRFLAHFDTAEIARLFHGKPEWKLGFLVPPPLDLPCKNLAELLAHLKVSLETDPLAALKAVCNHLSPPLPVAKNKDKKWFPMRPLLIAYRPNTALKAADLGAFYNALFSCTALYMKAIEPVSSDAEEQEPETPTQIIN